MWHPTSGYLLVYSLVPLSVANFLLTPASSSSIRRIMALKLGRVVQRTSSSGLCTPSSLSSQHRLHISGLLSLSGPPHPRTVGLSCLMGNRCSECTILLVLSGFVECQLIVKRIRPRTEGNEIKESLVSPNLPVSLQSQPSSDIEYYKVQSLR